MTRTYDQHRDEVLAAWYARDRYFPIHKKYDELSREIGRIESLSPEYEERVDAELRAIACDNPSFTEYKFFKMECDSLSVNRIYGDDILCVSPARFKRLKTIKLDHPEFTKRYENEQTD